MVAAVEDVAGSLAEIADALRTIGVELGSLSIAVGERS